MNAKHVTFISDEGEWFKNDELLKSGRFIKKWNKHVYSHIKENVKIPDSNLVIIFGKDALKRLQPGREISKFFIVKTARYYSIPNYSYYDTYTKTEQNNEFKKIKKKLENFFKKFALVRVTHKDFYYRDLNFQKIKLKNRYKNDGFYVEDPSGGYTSYDGKNLKKVSRDFQTFEQTYEKHLSARELFYYEQFPNVGHSKILSYFTYDIETHMSLDVNLTPEPIISIAGYSNVYNKMFVWVLKKYDTQEIDKERFKDYKLFSFSDEREMLIHFLKTLKKIDIDLLGGWNSGNYDNQYLINRIKSLRITELGDTFRSIYRKSQKDGSVIYMCEDTIFWDYLEYCKWITFVNKPKNWTLDEVAFHYFGERKLEQEGTDKLWEDDINKLIAYNIQDVKLTEKINVMARLIELPILYQKICPQDFENVFYNSKTVDNMLHQKFKPMKFPTKVRRQGKKFEGALVTEPTPGLYENVIALDYAGLYPNITITFNISKDTIVRDGEFDPKTMAKIGDVVFRLDKKGVIPQLTGDLIKERMKIKADKKKFDGNSLEFKLLDDFEACFKALINSVYGVLGFPGFVLYDRDAAKSVTYIDREILRFTIQKGAEYGYKNLFSDTDSVFFQMESNKTSEELIIDARNLVDKFNNDMREFVSKFTENEEYINNHTFEIEFERMFSKIFFSEAKKKQVGYLIFKKGKILKPQLETKGFESVKHDTPTFFRKALEGLYRVILDDFHNFDKLKEYSDKVRKELKQQDVDSLIIYKKLSKNLSEYDGLPMHVRALQNSKVHLKRGENVNMIFVTDEREVLHYDPDLKQKFTLDYKKYYQKFFIDKFEYLDKDTHYKLFLSRTTLLNKSKVNIQKRKKKKIQTKQLGA